MTTNLYLRRPNTLPHLDGNHYFKEAEFRRLFPGWIVDYMMQASADSIAAARQAGGKVDLPPAGCHVFPSDARLPLVVAARMSLSFPILFTTVPLYRKDYPHQGTASEPPVERMLFSDGGLSSNFPVHFFDALLPTRPTFGISLESYDTRDPRDRRVSLAMDPRRAIWLTGDGIETLPAFLMVLVNAAKDWQDRLQSTLPGYRERIACVYLKDEEGGLNLTMPSVLIDQLVAYGDRAGGLMTGAALMVGDEAPFDFDEHRWRRYLVAFA